MEEKITAENLKRFLEQQAERVNKDRINKKVGKIQQHSPIIEEDFDPPEDFENSENTEENYSEDLSVIVPKREETKEEFKIPPTKFHKKTKTAQKSNPLSNYFRKPGISIKLPTMGIFNDEEDIDFSPNGEVQVYPLTAKDEIWLRNPDALLNGTALEKVFESCCPNIKNIRNIPINDVNALLVALRNCSYGHEMKMSATCPHCKKMNNFIVDLDILLGNMTFFEEIPSFEINGLTVYFCPVKYENMVYFEILIFEEAKVLQTIQNEDLDEEKKKEIVQNAVTKIAEIGIYILTNGIYKIITPEGDEVTEKEFIYEFLTNCPSDVYKRIQKEFEKITQIGVPTQWKATCNGCEKEFDVEVQYDPANFFAVNS